MCPLNIEQSDSLVPKAFQDRFFRRVGASQLRPLQELLPGVDYFIKDHEGRFVAISEGARSCLGLGSEEEIIGRLDREIQPPAAAATIREDDLRVMTTGKPLVDRLEAPSAPRHHGRWLLTTKLPVFAPNGDIVGVMGFVRPFQPERDRVLRPAVVQSITSHIQEHARERIHVSTLAKLAHISARHLNRRFQETLHMSVQEYMVQTRVRSAMRELLQTRKSIREIAANFGFYDQSAFTKAFRRLIGATPYAHRRRWQPRAGQSAA